MGKRKYNAYEPGRQANHRRLLLRLQTDEDVINYIIKRLTDIEARLALLETRARNDMLTCNDMRYFGEIPL